MLKRIIHYPGSGFEEFLAKRRILASNITSKVSNIIDDVRERGDDALRDSLSKYYGLPRETPLVVKKSILTDAINEVPEDFIEAIKTMKDNLERLMEALKPSDISIDYATHRSGVVWKPLDSVGIYVPGGMASYPSTAVMSIVPAKVAGVEHVYVATPPKNNGLPDKHTLAALSLLGVEKVFLIGGAEAAAAFAYGTQTVPKVDKIIGPGGIWFTTAKSLVSSIVGIDILAGPTELVVIAGRDSSPELVAWDLAAQAEHSPDTFPILVTDDESLVIDVNNAFEEILTKTPRRDIIRQSLENNGAAIIVDNMAQAVEVVNQIAPEHVHISVKNADSLFRYIKNAGAVSIGQLTPSSFPDYFAGVNHILPTNAWARFRGGLSVFDFLKPIYYTKANCKGLEKYVSLTKTIAGIEELWGHYGAFEARISQDPCSDPEEQD